MAYAPHHNGEIYNVDGVPCKPRLIASFVEKDHGHLFEVADRAGFHPHRDMPGPWSLEALPHYVYVGNGEERMARVLKTVAYVAVDEDADGNPVIEKWSIKQHREYAA